MRYIMDEDRKNIPHTSEFKNVLPDVVHLQQVPALETESSVLECNASKKESSGKGVSENDDISEIESISEHVPSKLQYSLTESEVGQPHSHDLSKYNENENTEQISMNSEVISKDSDPKSKYSESVTKKSENILDNSSLHIPISNAQSAVSPGVLDPSQSSTSWNHSDVHISEESPVILALSSDTSKEAAQAKLSPNSSRSISPKESPRSEYLDSLNDNYDQNSNDFIEDGNSNCSRKNDQSAKKESLEENSSGSDIIKLDIRGQAASKFPLHTEKIIFGPPPSGTNTIGPILDPIPNFQNLLSPCLVSANDGVKIEEVFDDKQQSSPLESVIESQNKSLSPVSLSTSGRIEQDVLVEEMTINEDMKEKYYENVDTVPGRDQQDETISFTTMSTDYKTICEEYHAKLVHLEEAITLREKLIAELTISLQRSQQEQNTLKLENEHLISEVQDLQHVIGERSQSDHDTIKGQLSDYIKYQNMLKDDSTKFYSALMSGTSSIQSSNGEKDMDREEITVNYSKSDLRSSGSPEEFQIGIEDKLTVLLSTFDNYIEENLRNKLREGMIQILGDEIGKMRVEYDTDVKELETHSKQDKQESISEIRRLRELLSSVKAGSADIEELQQEMNVKHEKEMENLRTYFEKKLEQSYSEDVRRAGSCASPAGSDGDAGAGDARPLHRSLTLEFTSTPDNTLKVDKKYEQMIEDLKMEHIAYVNELQARHKEAIVSFEEQISQLKAHIQTAENTESSEQLFLQDIDLELEKGERASGRDARVRALLLRQLQDQLQVLLSDPDAELSSWPLELVALRDKIHGESRASAQDKEFSSIRDEAPGETDKWRQRRNNSFDQNRQLEEITKERDSLKRVAVTLQRVVGQLVAYCASAEDELNRTVLGQLLRLAEHDRTFEDSRPCSPGAAELDCSVVSRGKHVHFAPDLDAILAALDEGGVAGFLQQQRDVSADIKRELEHSLRRLRREAHELLELSAKLSGNRVRNESKMLESSPVRITELVQELEDKNKSCDNCQLQKKNMEEAMAECLQREKLLRADLEAAMVKIAQLLAGEDRQSDVIAEGYGAGDGGSVMMSRPSGPGVCRSLEETRSPREHLARELELLQRERDDLLQQLEAANRQLRSTRQFVEEQATEREAERDEFAARLRELRDDNTRLAARLQTNARILAEVEQLETQTREMNQIIVDLESRKATTDEELKATDEKVTLLRDIIANLETQLEQKTVREGEVLEQLEQMKRTIDERDGKMRALLGELESLKSERVEQSDFMCVKCGQEEDKYVELADKIKEETARVCSWVSRRRQRLERAHEHMSPPASELTEDVSLPDRRHAPAAQSPERSPRAEGGGALAALWEALQAHARAEDAALKRIADLEMQRAALKDVAQEVRAERDVLQARMSEQALRISSLSARLQQQRNDAEALAHAATGQLGVRLHDAEAEVQRLLEELESKDKQLMRLKQNLEERDRANEKQQSLYGNSCNPKDKVIILERELSNAQTKIAQLEEFARSLEMDKETLKASVREQQRELAEKEEQLNEIMALKLEDEQNQNSAAIEAKASARTLSDIVSISEYDEQDLQMRRAELKHQNMSFTVIHEGDKTNFNKTLPPEVQQPNLSSLNIDYVDHFDVTNYTPRADSLPIHLTSTQNREYNRNVNETTAIGNKDKLVESAKHSTAQKILENCSMFPNRKINEGKNISVEPKKINFSIEPSLEPTDNRMQDEELTSLHELGITLDVKQQNFPDILTQLKREIIKSRTELETCKSELKNAEEQLCEFPALKEEVEQLKNLLENTVAAMENDKKFYENQLDSFSSNKNLLEQRLAELTHEVGEKSKDLHLLKEDILRRENMILELAKEKRNLTNKIAELDKNIEELQNKNIMLEKYEIENKQMREQINELKKLEQLVSEKNQQIDSLNQHLDRLDDLQRRLNDKSEEAENLKEALNQKSNALFQMQDSVSALTRDITNVVEENNQLSDNNKELRLKLSKIEKEQENASIKLQNSESEVERLNSLNSDLSARIEEMRQLNEQLKDKETEIEILHEDINLYHSEVASLREQLKMISRSPSPKNKSIEEKKTADRQAANDTKQLVKIKKQISLLQHEIDFNKKELNDKAFELAKAKLDLTELKTNLSQAMKQIMDKEANNTELQQQALNQHAEIEKLKKEKQQLSGQLDVVLARLREESNISEVKEKLREKAEKCQELEVQLINMKEFVDRARQDEPASRALSARSPTAELERAVRDELDYSRALDRDMMEQILSASSDERDDIPRLALNTSRSSSIHSSSSERISRLRNENEKLEMKVNNLECRLKDKDALIAELNRVREQLATDWQCARLRYEAERDNSARLLLLLDSQKESAEAVRQQDSSVIALLQRRLEGAMRAEAELQQQTQRQQQQHQQLQRPCVDGDTRREVEMEQLKSELSMAKSKLEQERRRNIELQAVLEHARAQAQRDARDRDRDCAALRTELAELRRLKHDAGVELARSQELLRARSDTVAQLEARLAIQQDSKERRGLQPSPRGAGSPDARHDPEQAIRYLHGRCLHLESCRKALAWQKRYLQRALAGYEELERRLEPHAPEPRSRGLRRFRCVVWVAVVALRMRYVAARRTRVRAFAADCVLRVPAADNVTTLLTPVSRAGAGGAGAGARVRRDLRLTLPQSPGDVSRSPYTITASTPRLEPFTLNSPRADTLAAHLSGKLSFGRLP